MRRERERERGRGRRRQRGSVTALEGLNGHDSTLLAHPPAHTHARMYAKRERQRERNESVCTFSWPMTAHSTLSHSPSPVIRFILALAPILLPHLTIIIRVNHDTLIYSYSNSNSIYIHRVMDWACRNAKPLQVKIRNVRQSYRSNVIQWASNDLNPCHQLGFCQN